MCVRCACVVYCVALRSACACVVCGVFVRVGVRDVDGVSELVSVVSVCGDLHTFKFIFHSAQEI